MGWHFSAGIKFFKVKSVSQYEHIASVSPLEENEHIYIYITEETHAIACSNRQLFICV